MKQVKSNLKELLKARDMQQKELANRADVREATISALCNNKLKEIPRDVLERIVNVLEIEDMNKLLEIVEDNEENDAK